MANFRILTDDDGQKYRFNYKTFSLAIKDQSLSSKDKEKSLNFKSCTNIMQDIANQVNVSFETVKKWKLGTNGPSDISIVKECALALHKDYCDLLIPIEHKIDFNLSKYETCLISDVFEAIISAVAYDDTWADYREDLMGNKNITSDKIHAQHQEILYKLKKVHALINMKSLCTSAAVRSKLHRLVEESSIYFTGDFEYPVRWNKSLDNHFGLVNSIYLISDNKEDFVVSQYDLGIGYVEDEILMAEDYNFYDNVFDKDAFENINVLPSPECNPYIELCNNMGPKEIHLYPYEMFLHFFTKGLHDMILFDFPELPVSFKNAF